MRSLLVALGLLPLLCAAPASAETWHGDDALKDVSSYRFSPRPEPCGTFQQRVDRHDRRHDLTGLDVDHTSDAITVTLSLRSVARRDHQVTYDVHLRTPDHRYVISVDRGLPLAGSDEPYLFDEPRFGKPDRCGFSAGGSTGVPCAGLSAQPHPGLDTVEVVVPRTCVADPAWVKVGANVRGYGTYHPDGRFSGASDEWAPAGVDTRGANPPYSPRVHSS